MTNSCDRKGSFDRCYMVEEWRRLCGVARDTVTDSVVEKGENIFLAFLMRSEQVRYIPFSKLL